MALNRLRNSLVEWNSENSGIIGFSITYCLRFKTDSVSGFPSRAHVSPTVHRHCKLLKLILEMRHQHPETPRQAGNRAAC
jgi:hypothetical protein